jgi:hypothetical protein
LRECYRLRLDFERLQRSTVRFELTGRGEFTG